MRSITSFVRSTTLFAEGNIVYTVRCNLVLCPQAERCWPKGQMMIAVSPQNDVVSCGHKHKNKDTIFIVSLFLERITGLEPATSTLARWRSTKWAKSAGADDEIRTHDLILTKDVRYRLCHISIKMIYMY